MNRSSARGGSRGGDPETDLHVGLLYSRIRTEEKWLLRRLRDRGHEVTKVDVREQRFDLSEPPACFEGVDLLVDRCLAASRSGYVTRFAASYGVPVVNHPGTARVCADKVECSLALADAGVPTPRTEVAFDRETALAAAEDLGYPCVVKPVVGSWGRLVSKLDSRTAAEAVLEHKEQLGHYEHGVFYLQEFVDKPGRDIRVLAADGEPVAAMARSADHWLTNAAKGADVEAIAVDGELRELVRAASDAVGGGLLGVDLMETGDGYTVHELNHTVEFEAIDGAVDVDVPGAVVDFLEARAAGDGTAGDAGDGTADAGDGTAGDGTADDRAPTGVAGPGSNG